MLTLLSHIGIRCSWQKQTQSTLKKAWGERMSLAFTIQSLAPSLCVLPQQIVPLAVLNGVRFSSQELLQVAVTRRALL